MPAQLSVNDRVLLHLSRFATDTAPEEHPRETTQVGIAEGAGISRTHVPRAVKSLVGDGLVEEGRGRVSGKGRRMSVYRVTPEGFRRADRLWEDLRKSDIDVLRNGKKGTMRGEELEELMGRKRAIGAVSRMKDGVVEVQERPRVPVRDLGKVPALSDFVGRAAELRALEEFVDSESRTMVVLGNRGYGTTSLVRRFVGSREGADVLWLTVEEGASAELLERAIVDFARSVDPEVDGLGAALDLPTTIIVLDDYHSVPEDVVEFFSSMVNEEGDTKIVITAREDTPAYNWFYQKRHVESGTVREVRVRGLDEASARKLLGSDEVDDDAFRRVYLMSRGQPLMLKLLRDGDFEGLKKNSVYTAEEIRYIMFLKDRKK